MKLNRGTHGRSNHPMNFWRILLPVGLLLAPFIARGGGDEVVVIYKSQLPES